MKKAGILLFLLCPIALSWAQTAYLTQIKKADSLYKAKDYTNAALTYSAAFNIGKEKINPIYRYNAACAWALANYPDSAFRHLYMIAGKSYFIFDQLNTDTDLNTLHTDKRWLSPK